MLGSRIGRLGLPLVLCVCACSDGATDATTDAADTRDTAPELDAVGELDAADAEPTAARLLFDLEGGFFAAPFPIVTRVDEIGRVRVADFPNPDDSSLLNGYLDVIGALTDGFPRNGSIFLTFDAPLDAATLPTTLDASRQPAASAFVLDVDPTSPTRGERLATRFQFHADDGAKLRPPNLLTALPYPGLVQRADTLYAAVITDSVRAADGGRVGAPALLTELLEGRALGADDALAAAFGALAETLETQGIDVADVVAATVYRTGNPTASTAALLSHADALPAPEVELVERIRDHATFCVLEAEVDLPIYQSGERPYRAAGEGGIVFVDGQPQVAWTERVRLSISLPKAAMPDEGYPLLLYAPGSGGSYTQVVDRGTFDEQQTGANGRGPARLLADINVAAVSLEAPLTGPRHPDGSFDNADFFSPVNLTSFRDNTRQSAAELVVLANAFTELALDVSVACPDVPGDAGTVRFDARHFAFWGHSTGATIGHLVLGLDRAFEAGILTGAGGSWNYNLTLKQRPLNLAELAGTLLGLPQDEVIDPFHPLAMLFQMAIDSTEAMSFARLYFDEAPAGDATNILLIGGLIDGFFLPRMINALAMAGRFDLAGPALEPTLLDDLALVGGQMLELPAGANRGATSGHLVHIEAGEFDGHYVAFELERTKYIYRCWLSSLIESGEAVVPLPVDDALAPCP